MKQKIHPDLAAKLKETTDRYAKVTAFAERLPLFASRIIADEITGENYSSLSSNYKTLYFNWGIKWTMRQELTNRKELLKPSEVGLVDVYINCCSLFPDDCYAEASKSLHDAMQDVPVFYTDWLNSTFYFKPDEVENGLEALHNWYATMQGKIKEIRQANRKAELLAELAKLENKE